MLGSKQGSGWEELKEDESFLCGFVQLDIAKIRELKGSRVKLKKTKENFAEFVRAILTSHGHACIKWEGDGGAFIFRIQEMP